MRKSVPEYMSEEQLCEKKTDIPCFDRVYKTIFQNARLRQRERESRVKDSYVGYTDK